MPRAARATAFVRHAPSRQKRALWTAAATALENRVREAPVWLHTEGSGVAWLHLRLDSRPKYYHHRPYAGRRLVGGSRSFPANR